ncbi:hypothetical protein DRQ25_13475 [Candidatus Fermentibacteria bacterium]|nr:MAG: hypothetical protein DRQ25_13475 [Candidatus Fermentibacteria bacterium]
MLNKDMITVTATKEDWVIPYIEKALVYSLGEHSALDVLQNKILLVVKDDDEVLTVLSLEVVDTPQKRILNIITAGGKDMYRWVKEADQAITRIAKEMGASNVTIHGRRGWSKVLKDLDYKEQYTVLSKEIL